MTFGEPTAQGTAGGLCFIEPGDAIGMIVPTLDGERKEILLDACVSAWADLVPEDELALHYAKAVEALDAHDIDSLANWLHSLTERKVIPGAGFLQRLLPSLSDARRAALKLATGLRMKAPVYEETIDIDDALGIVLPLLGEQGMMQVARVALDLYVLQHGGSNN